MGFSRVAVDPINAGLPGVIVAGLNGVSGDFQKGDIVVFQPTPLSNPEGHIQVFDGTMWVSDWKQGFIDTKRTIPRFLPNQNTYRDAGFEIYRFTGNCD